MTTITFVAQEDVGKYTNVYITSLTNFYRYMSRSKYFISDTDFRIII